MDDRVEEDCQGATPSGPRAIGRILGGRYRLGVSIGRGGMGTIYRARDLVGDRDVAIKLISFNASANDVRSRVHREALILGTMRDEHAVRLYDVGTLRSGSLFLVMELLEGRDLAALLRDAGALDVSLAVDFVLQACEAMREAHMRGIVHRDLKPQNLFLATQPDGSAIVKVIDFGVAKCWRGFTPESRALTLPNTTMGSVHYMAPEQMQSADTVDLRADIWSLGVILYELVTGQPPYNGDSLAGIFNAIMRGEVGKASLVRADLPTGLDEAIARCMEKKPEDRFANVEELANALAPFASESGQLSARRIESAVVDHGTFPASDEPAKGAWPELAATILNAASVLVAFAYWGVHP